ncbi:hypothetical protein Q73A0000_11010 [Kaistella flava (ex Peng et al. 2021)]|uniref:Lipoprotein n=1 Tax=Kaistella flava (ex Peng et al. 2021) TaxID=2038776 RepID=A0A7M2Y9A5_9FLAO|nr:hypothetical protein [Kaistella flava (ex Peng et al. 2021)]QOW10847.1 hypothetical protein Q73A0000_11010 [Kaistella flava (ex Peng et al. 2021)]
MKKLLVILPLLLMSCTKKEAVSENTAKHDSVILSDDNIDNKMDSAANGNVSIDENNALKESFKTSRIIEGNKIIKTIQADMIPLTIADEFTKPDQQMVLKIENFTGKKIDGKITPENPQMNIRFNQIKLAKGDYDGPFGRDINYDIKENGEIWLLIGKSNMASGDTKGKFTINLK